MWAMLWYLGKAGTSWLIKMFQSKVSQRKYDRIKIHKLRLLVPSMVGFPTNWAKKIEKGWFLLSNFNELILRHPDHKTLRVSCT